MHDAGAPLRLARCTFEMFPAACFGRLGHTCLFLPSVIALTTQAAVWFKVRSRVLRMFVDRSRSWPQFDVHCLHLFSGCCRPTLACPRLLLDMYVFNIPFVLGPPKTKTANQKRSQLQNQVPISQCSSYPVDQPTTNNHPIPSANIRDIAR